MFDFSKHKNDSDLVVKKVVDWFDEAETARKPREEKWEEYYKLYRSYREDLANPQRQGRSNMFIPYTYSVIETVVPRIMTSLFAGNPFLGVLPVRAEDVPSAELLEALLDFVLMQKIKVKTIIQSWIRETCVYGTGMLKVGWEYREGTQMVQVPTLELFGETILSEVEEIEDVVLKDQPLIQHIDLWDVYVDPLGIDVDSCDYIIHKTYRDVEYLLDMEEAGVYSGVKEMLDARKEADSDYSFSGVNAYDSGTQQRLEAIGIQPTPAEVDKIELYECWTDSRVVVVADRRFLLRNEANPFYHGKKPFIRLVDVLVPHEFYGIGEIEPIAHLQHEINSFRNQRMDNINIIINRMWKVLRGTDVRKEDLISRPGGIIHVDDMGDIEEVRFEDVTGSSIEATIAMIKKDMDNANGVFDYTRGQTTDRRETATTASILAQAGAERFMLKTVTVEDLGLKRLGEMVVSLMQQFYTSDQVVRIMGEDGYNFVTVSPSNIVGDYDIIIRGTAVDPVLNKESRLAQMINLYHLLKDSPYIDHTTLIRRILETANIKDVESVLLSPEQQQEQMMQQMMLQQPQGAMPPANPIAVPTTGGVLENAGAGMY